MRSSNNELTVYRNETFAIDKTVKTKSGAPYIVSNELENPYILITVSSSKFEQKSVYKESYYLSLVDKPKFAITNPVNIKSILNAPNGESLYDDFPEGLTLIEDGDALVFMVGYYDGKEVGFEIDDAVFYVENANGISYKHWVPDEMVAGSTGCWEDYQFNFVKVFNKSETQRWVGQTYFYSIQLVSGKLTMNYLTEMSYRYGVTVLSYDNEQSLYGKLLNKGVKFPDGFNVNSPLAKHDYSVPLLVPTKISVLSNLEGELL